MLFVRGIAPDLIFLLLSLTFRSVMLFVWVVPPDLISLVHYLDCCIQAAAAEAAAAAAYQIIVVISRQQKLVCRPCRGWQHLPGNEIELRRLL